MKLMASEQTNDIDKSYTRHSGEPGCFKKKTKTVNKEGYNEGWVCFYYVRVM